MNALRDTQCMRVLVCGVAQSSDCARKGIEMTVTIAYAVNEARVMALAYVWGRSDAGDDDIPADAAQVFSDVYAERKEAFLNEHSVFMPPVRDAFKEWLETGRIHVRNARCGHGDWVANCPRAHGEIEGSLTRAEVEENARKGMTVKPWVTAHLREVDSAGSDARRAFMAGE